jgi:HlyD family secretion protein
MAQKKGTGWLKWVIILLILGGAGYAGWWYWNKPKEKGPEFRTATVTRGDITQAVSASGQLNPVVNVQVGSQISGNIQQLYADFNTIVTQNQVIAELDPSTYRAAVNQSEGELANARAALELAQVEARRGKELTDSKLLPASDYDKLIAQLHQSEAQVKIRESLLERARVDLGRCTIYAPTNGIVISRNVDVGQTVAASFSAPIIFVIANDLKRMQIDAMVSEADIGGVEIDQPVNFTVDAFPGRTFHGKVIQIRNSPATNQNVVTYDTVVSVENAEMKLKPGMTATVSIVAAEREDVLKVPSAALRFRPPSAAGESRGGGMGGGMRPRGESGGSGRGEGQGPGGAGGGAGRGLGEGGRRARGPSNIRTVYVLSSTNIPAEGPAPKPEPRQVKLGISDGLSTEVLEGLKEGEIVVVGSVSSDSAAQGRQQMQSGSPFGGGGGGFRGGR